ncbi:hypothetical protein J7K27_10755 [Candidatus Bathyarchaeota archaeon]|nr:hypothetical protein [Candidatus Bathyarchaeota archaeon]
MAKRKRVLNPFWLSGWEYLSTVSIRMLPKELQEKLKNKGDAVTIKKWDRYIRYVNKGWVTATGRIPLIHIYRRWRRKK